MRSGTKAIAAVVLGLVVVGCASGATPAPATPASEPTGAAPTQSGPGATPEPGSTDGPTAQPTQGGGSSAGVCELVPAAELETILGKPVVLSVVAGPPDTCDVQSDGAPIAAFVFMEGPSFGFAFDAWAADPSAEDVPGIGDHTVYVADSELLIVQRGDRLFSVSVYDSEIATDVRVQMMKDIGRAAAGRM